MFWIDEVSNKNVKKNLHLESEFNFLKKSYEKSLNSKQNYFLKGAIICIQAKYRKKYEKCVKYA